MTIPNDPAHVMTHAQYARITRETSLTLEAGIALRADYWDKVSTDFEKSREAAACEEVAA